METIANQILNSFSFFQDSDRFAAVVNSTSSEELCNIINGLLRSEYFDKVGYTCGFIRDLVMFGRGNPDCERFVKDYLEYSIIETLEELLFSPYHHIRQLTIYTLGKICSYKSLPALNRAFTAFRDTDPILLPRLISEMNWLGEPNFWELINSMMKSSVYITRWAVIDILGKSAEIQMEDELYPEKFQYIELLRGDSNILVRTQAEYEYQLLKVRREILNLPKPQRRKRRKEVERKYKPNLCFYHVEMSFRNYAGKNKLRQCSLGELEAFILNLTNNSQVGILSKK